MLRHRSNGVMRRPFYLLSRVPYPLSPDGTTAAVQSSMTRNITTWHFTVNGRGACAAPETLDERLRPCTTCSHGTRESAEADAQRVLELYPDARVEVREGSCGEPRGDYDYGYRDGYEAGLRAAAAAKEPRPG